MKATRKKPGSTKRTKSEESTSALSQKLDILRIDPMKLDDEWLYQPGLYMEWAEKAAKARAAFDRARAELDRTEATVAKDIRADPDKFGIPKATEAAIAYEVRNDDRYIRASNAHIKARMHSEITYRMTVALEQRKKALENLAFLTQQGYFSEPQKRKRRGVKAND